jgi:hypothetical protein
MTLFPIPGRFGIFGNPETPSDVELSLLISVAEGDLLSCSYSKDIISSKPAR